MLQLLAALLILLLASCSRPDPEAKTKLILSLRVLEARTATAPTVAQLNQCLAPVLEHSKNFHNTGGSLEVIKQTAEWVNVMDQWRKKCLAEGWPDPMGLSDRPVPVNAATDAYAAEHAGNLATANQLIHINARNAITWLERHP